MDFGIEICVQLIMKSGKWKMTEGIKLQNQEKNCESFEKRKVINTMEYWLWTPSNKGRERKYLKRIPQENEKTTQNQTTKQKSHQRDKHLVTILKMDGKRTSTNGPENKKTHANQKTLHLTDDVNRLYETRKEGGSRFAILQDSVDLTTRRL